MIDEIEMRLKKCENSKSKTTFLLQITYANEKILDMLIIDLFNENRHKNVRFLIEKSSVSMTNNVSI